jgi:uncharacterized protein (DUF305 family)
MRHSLGKIAMRRACAAMTVLAFALPAIAQHQHQHGALGSTPPAAATVGSQSFAELMDESMNKMNAGMAKALMDGDPDHDFASMMIPHHQGAVDMAKTELLYGKNPVLRRLAQEIIVTQGSEISVMQFELNKPAPELAPSHSSTR